MARVLIAGCGFVGTALGLRLAAAGHEVWGLRRNAGRLPAPLRPLSADLSNVTSLQNLPERIAWVFYAASADARTEEAYQRAYLAGTRLLTEALESHGQCPDRFVFTSSTAVYAQTGGEWVDEASPTEPAHFTGRILLEAERQVLEGPFPATVIRLAGIYGPGRRRLIESVRRGEATFREGEYTNRIHRDDCTGAMQHLMTLPRSESIYIGADHSPAERCEVLRWLADRLGAPPPRIAPPEKGDPTRQAGNKRCANALLLATGYRFLYPTYREGYENILTHYCAD